MVKRGEVYSLNFAPTLGTKIKLTGAATDCTSSDLLEGGAVFTSEDATDYAIAITEKEAGESVSLASIIAE